MLLNYQKPARLQGAVPAFALILLLSARPATSQENEVKANLRSGRGGHGETERDGPEKRCPDVQCCLFERPKRKCRMACSTRVDRSAVSTQSGLGREPGECGLANYAEVNTVTAKL